MKSARTEDHIEIPAEIHLLSETKYYYMCLEACQDTQGQQARLTRYWGGRFSRRGGRKTEYMPILQGKRKWVCTVKTRKRHGYREVAQTGIARQMRLSTSVE
jgi:predicted DNA-binding WGR domain protein